jgi:hypothetical protein
MYCVEAICSNPKAHTGKTATNYPGRNVIYTIPDVTEGSDVVGHTAKMNLKIG